ncbi:MAG: M48 family metalloprotease [Anaeromyxobacteraceae bacterium]|nr:M48 family metalloprotease [Anaeromyxobacteraceae bacterium]
MASPILPLFVGLIAIEQTADVGLIALNLWHTRRAPAVPEELDGLVEVEAAERARAHALASGTVALWRAASSALASIALLAFGLLPQADRWLGAAVGRDTGHAFVLLLGGLALLSGLIDLPFSAWNVLSVERRFGLSALSWRAFLLGRLRSWAIIGLAGVPLLYAAHAVVALGGAAWWLGLFGLLALVQVASAWLWPEVVAPRLQRQRRLPDGELKDRLEALARRAGFPEDAIRVVEAARRGGPPNAALAGLGRPRLLLDDTLLELLGPDQVLAVAAHELGHYRHGHLRARLLVGLAGSFVLLGLVALSFSWPGLYEAFGFAGPSPQAALAVAAVGGGLVAFWLAPLQSWVSRRQELEADAEAVRLTGSPEALGAALLDLAEDRLANPCPHPWFVAWRFTHPPVLTRLLALSSEAAEA